MSGRRGFTIIELLVVLLFIGVLTGIALLKYIDLRNTARTAALTGDFRSVTVATFNYNADKDAWPAETGAGVVPVDLVPYLPGELAQSFDRVEYMLDYENIPLGGPSNVIAVSVTTGDAKLMAKFIQTFSTKWPFFMNGGKLTYLISGP